MRLHLVGLPHTETTNEFVACAYTSKVVKGAKMLTDAGYEVVIYAGEENDAPCAEHVCIVGRGEQGAWFGDQVNGNGQFANIWGHDEPWWRVMNARAVVEIGKRMEPRDLVLILGGLCQRSIADGVHPLDAEVIEWGCGYEGIFTRCVAFESYSHMHTVYAQQGWGDGRLFDRVIPNYFDPDDFPMVNQGDGDYLLYVGRLARRKGLEIAARTSRETGIPLVVAGQGATKWGEDWVESDEIGIRAPGLEYVGRIGRDERAELMAGAVAVMAPTLYIEPFGGVAVEAQMAGTPAITTDWGAFTETVEPGWRARRLDEFCAVAESARDLTPEQHDEIRERAIRNYGLRTVGRQYASWFDMIQMLWGEGWDDLSERRERMVTV